MTPWFLGSATRGRWQSTELKWRRQFLLRQVHRYLQSFIISKDLHPHMALCASSSCERKSWDLFLWTCHDSHCLREWMAGGVGWARMYLIQIQQHFFFELSNMRSWEKEHYHVRWKIIPTFNKNFWFYWNYFEK